MEQHPHPESTNAPTCSSEIVPDASRETQIDSDEVGLEQASFSRTDSINKVIQEIYDTWGDSPYGYQWPASRLSRHEMGRLTIVSKEVRKPLNQLIKEAVSFYADKMLDELGYEVPNQSPFKQGPNEAHE